MILLISIRGNAQTAYTWSGATNTSYTTASNWVPEGIPGTEDSALIPAGVTNFPVLTVNHTTGSITIENEASLRLQGNGSVGSVTLTVVNDLQNNGELQLGATSSWVGTIIVTNGTLSNNGKIISTQTNEHSAPNIITANTDNSGEIITERNLTFNKSGGSLANSGSIEIAENLSINFTNNSRLEFTSGSITGTGNLNMTNATLALATDFETSLVINLVTSVVDGPGKFIISETGKLLLNQVTINASFENNGLTEVIRNSSVAGETVINQPGGLISVQGNGSYGTTIFTLQNSLQNNGELQFRATSSWVGTLNIIDGTLRNNGTITSAATNQHSASNVITADTENPGEIVLERSLIFNKSGGSLTNTGSITIGEAGVLSFTNTALNNESGSIAGTGSLATTNSTVQIAGGIDTRLTVNMTNSTLSFPGDLQGTIQMNLTGTSVDGAGTFMVSEDSKVVLNEGTINSSLDNSGFIEVIRNSTIAGETVLNQPGGLISVQGNGSYGTTILTFQHNLQNNGEIRLSATSSWTGNLVIADAKIVNNGTIISTGTNQHAAPNLITAAVDNAGEIIMERNLNFNKNGGLISTSGTINTGDGYSLNFLNNGTLEYLSGTIEGSGTMTLTNMTMVLVTDYTSTIPINLFSTSVDGPGKMIVGEEVKLEMNLATINAPFENRGLTTVTRNSTIAGQTTTNNAGAKISVQGNGSGGQTTLTLRFDLVNHGDLELSATSSWTGVLTIAEGKLINHGRITSGQTNAHASSNVITSEVDNRGSILVERPLTLNEAGATHSNVGEIRLEGGNLTVTQSGSDPVFVNSGTLFMDQDRTATITGGKFINTVQGVVTGIGTLAIGATTFENHGTFMPGLRPAFGINLIVNGDAESNTAGNTASNIVIAGWSDSGPLSVLPYDLQGTTDAYPASADPGPADRGQNYFYGGANAFSSTITQTINVAPIRTLIDLETVNYDMSGYLGGLGSQGDNMKLTARFLNAESAELGTAEIGPVSNTDRENQTGLFFRETGGLLPSGTRSIELTLASSRVSGTEINGFADNLSLVLSLIDGEPEGRTTGVLTVNGDFPMTSESARIIVGLGGRIQGETYDRLHITGTATLAGVLMADTINGLKPVTGDEFNVITYGSHTGEFSFIAGTDVGSGLFLVPEYNGDNMALTVPGDPIVLTAPDLLSPADESIGVSTIPDLRWSLVPGTAAYHLQVSENEDFSEPLLDKDNVLAVTYRTGQLEPFVTYHWRARATNSAGAGDWSPVFSFTTGATVVNIEEQVAEIPGEYFLGSNYPNPFNPQTTIRFGLPEAGFVTLDVYDMLGRRVATLVNSPMAAGYHTVMFGSTSLSSGIYFYRISAGEFHQVRKMMMLK
ncbi:MAG: T9SS type A sorting domain-containing protein [Rhodothermaceae bacterium]|nr:T9SS type A sorting domain-containing protein [Rhodothermaceae bacterium]